VDPAGPGKLAYARIRVIERTAEALGRLATQRLAAFSDADEARNGPETLKLEAGVGIEPAYTALQAADTFWNSRTYRNVPRPMPRHEDGPSAVPEGNDGPPKDVRLEPGFFSGMA